MGVGSCVPAVDSAGEPLTYHAYHNVFRMSTSAHVVTLPPRAYLSHAHPDHVQIDKRAGTGGAGFCFLEICNVANTLLAVSLTIGVALLIVFAPPCAVHLRRYVVIPSQVYFV